MEGHIWFHLLQLIAVNLLCQVAVKPFLPPPSYKTLPFCSVPGCTDFNGAQQRLELWQWKRQRGSETGVEGRMKQTDRWVGDQGEARCTDYWDGQVGRHIPGKTGRGERWKWEKRGAEMSLIKKKGTCGGEWGEHIYHHFPFPRQADHLFNDLYARVNAHVSRYNFNW